MSDPLRSALDSGLEALDLPLPDKARADLIRYVHLLARWNRTYNLTAVDEPLAMVRRHLLDCLTVLPYVAGPSVLDVGTGAGLPGLIIARARPDVTVTALDANAKKTRFCLQAVAALGLTNVSVVHGRVEDYRPSLGFSTIISRALTDLGDFLAATRHLCTGGGRWVAMKGRHPASELQALVEDPDHGGSRVDVHPVAVPGLDGERHVVVVENPKLRAVTRDPAGRKTRLGHDDLKLQP